MKVEPFFLPGSEWIYFKIYVGEGYSNKLLVEKINPLISKHIEKRSVIHWFFIRYNDPVHHLRIRILLKKIQYLTEVLFDFEKIGKKLTIDGYVSDLQVTTYKRELCRYGRDNIQIVEKIWYWESILVISSIIHFGNDKNHVLNMVGAVHLFLRMYFTHDLEIVNHVHTNNDLYCDEFQLKKEDRRKLDLKFREILPQMEERLDQFNGRDNYPTLFLEHNRRLSPLVKQLNKELAPGLCASLVHMLVNRAFDRSQRKMEMVIYHHLLKYYKSRLARFNKI